LLVKAGYSLGVKALTPFAHDLARRIETRRNDFIAKPLARQEDDLGSDDVAIR
jgi:hypothetical protein